MLRRDYKRPFRKLYQPGLQDRIGCAIPDGAIVRVTAGWGPFRAIETVEQPTQRGTCWKSSLAPVPHKLRTDGPCSLCQGR